MSESEKIEKLREILKSQIEWYVENIEDQGYIYDEMHDQFNDLSRGDFESIIKILVD